jgi:hypothetical protein
MHKFAKYAIATNFVLILLYVILSFFFSGIRVGDLLVLWNPFWLTAFNYRSLGDIGIQYPNFELYLFCASLAVNLFIILMMSRELSKHNKTAS